MLLRKKCSIFATVITGPRYSLFTGQFLWDFPARRAEWQCCFVFYCLHAKGVKHGKKSRGRNLCIYWIGFLLDLVTWNFLWKYKSNGRTSNRKHQKKIPRLAAPLYTPLRTDHLINLSIQNEVNSILMNKDQLTFLSILAFQFKLCQTRQTDADCTLRA